MLGNAVSFTVATALGYWALRRRIGRLGLTHVFATLGRIGLAALVAAGPAALTVFAMTRVWGDAKIASLATLVVASLVLLGTYVAVALALGVREVRQLASMVRSRLAR
jgi:putative peptidoglycan lipid II flippase